MNYCLGHFNTSQQFYSEESLCKPIKLYLTFVVQELLIGLPSEVSYYISSSH